MAKKPSILSGPRRDRERSEEALSMSIRKLTVAAVATLGLSLGAYSASAGSVNEGAALSSAKAPSTFTLVRGGGGMGGGGMGHGGGGFGGGHMGGMAMGGHMGGMGGHMGGMHFGGPGFGGRSFAGPGINRGFYGGRTAFYRPGFAGRGIYAGRGFDRGRRAVFFHGRRGFFRNGRFFPFVGVGLWDWDYGYGYGGSCYSNCLAAGYGPRFCSVNAYNFCY
jgi:hypothetical protein